MHEVKILIVEDEGIEALDIQHRLVSLGYPTPAIAFSGEEAVQKAGEISPDLVLMDIMLPGEIDGITAAELIKARLDIPVIYLTAYADDNTLQRAKIHGTIRLYYQAFPGKRTALGKGSEFVVSLPLDSTPGAELQDVPAESPRRSRRVLIIDDYADIAESLRELLELNNHEVAVAYNGPDGIAKAREFRPEILLCDIGLPRMNGYEVARAFRRDKELSNVYLVAMTGYALPEDLQRAADAGFDCHLAKPVEIDKLNSILAQLP